MEIITKDHLIEVASIYLGMVTSGEPAAVLVGLVSFVGLFRIAKACSL